MAIAQTEASGKTLPFIILISMDALLPMGTGLGSFVDTKGAGVSCKCTIQRMLREHGSTLKNRHEFVGFNLRMEGIQAAVLRIKLSYLDDWNNQRRACAAKYGEQLARAGVTLPIEMSYGRHVYHLYVVQSDDRDELADFLRAEGIRTSIHYPVPIHLQPAYQVSGQRSVVSGQGFPVAERLASRVLSLPMFPELTDGEIKEVAEKVRAFDVHRSERLYANRSFAD